MRQICRIVDTLALARERHPGQRNNLDALCKRYGIDNSNRQLHGALLDARMLADVYLAMTGGQSLLALDESQRELAAARSTATAALLRPAEPLLVLRASEAERAAHTELLALLGTASGGRCVWSLLDAPPAMQAAASPASVSAAAAKCRLELH